jgi:hypothetical protein
MGRHVATIPDVLYTNTRDIIVLPEPWVGQRAWGSMDECRRLPVRKLVQDAFIVKTKTRVTSQ